MIQQGQVFKLKTKGTDGQPPWAYRYRLEGRSSERPQVGGFATRAEAEKALRKVLDRLGPGGGRATITLAEFRHTYATFALRAGVPVFAVSRFMGTSIAMVDRHYGHLANDSREHAVSLLDALALERAVDAAWTSPPRPGSQSGRRLRPLERTARGAAWTLGGRRALFLWPHQKTKGADKQR
jgi:hypothetical protein